MLAERLSRVHAQCQETVAGFDIAAELESVLQGVGLSAADSGGSVEFQGQDPIVPSVLRLASAAGIGLAAKSVGIAKLWRLRGGKPQDISIDLGQALHRLSPFYERKWELLNGYPPGMPSDPTCPFMPRFFYKTRDDRHVLALNIYPRLKTAALKLLRCYDDPQSVANAIRQWKAEDLEQAAEEHGLQATMVRTIEEYRREAQFQIVARLPLIEVEKIGDSAPEPLPWNGNSPLDGIRALGLGHVIAGSGVGRALALHGADVLNVWRPSEFEFDLLYYTANVGMRSTTLELGEKEGLQRFKSLLRDADILFANRRFGWLQKFGLSASETAEIRPGIIHANITLHGEEGPWKNRIGFDQSAGAVTGILALEGTPQTPKLPAIFVVNDYLVSWLTAVGIIAALERRATEGGSYRVHVSLARVALWIQTLGIFDKSYARALAGSAPDHLYRPPNLFTADTPCGIYQGVTEQVRMSETPGQYRTVLVPRGSSRPEWLSRG